MKLLCCSFTEIVSIHFSLQCCHFNFNSTVSFEKVFVSVFFEFHLLLRISINIKFENSVSGNDVSTAHESLPCKIMMSDTFWHLKALSKLWKMLLFHFKISFRSKDLQIFVHAEDQLD